MLPATILTAIVGVLLFTAAPQLMQRKAMQVPSHEWGTFCCE